jgi:hypothetical protein
LYYETTSAIGVDSIVEEIGHALPIVAMAGAGEESSVIVKRRQLTRIGFNLEGPVRERIGKLRGIPIERSFQQALRVADCLPVRDVVVTGAGLAVHIDRLVDLTSHT